MMLYGIVDYWDRLDAKYNEMRDMLIDYAR